MKKLEKYPIIMIIIGLIGIASSSILVKFSNAPAVIIAVYRLSWTVVLMTPFVLGSKELRRELKKLQPRLILLCAASGAFLAIHFICWFESLKQTSVASSTAIVSTEVIWVALGYTLFMKGKMKGSAILCIAVTIFGSLLIAFSDFSKGGSHLYGDFLALAAAILVGAYTLLGREARKTMTTAAYTYLVYLACAIVLIVLALLGGFPLIGYGVDTIMLTLGLAVFATLLGHSMFNYCLKFFSPAFVSASKLCQPIIVAILAYPLFGEIPTFMQIVGGIITLAGVLFYSLIEMKQE